jgi:hypothetical protein
MPLWGGNGWGSGGWGGVWGGSVGPIYKEPLAYYLNLFTSQYKLSKNLLSWAAKAWQPLDDLTTCLTSMSSAFNPANAVGIQLDILGLLIGVSRVVGFQPSGGVSPVLDDNTYRILLLARIQWDKWNGTLASLPLIWQTMFPSGRLVVNDNQNMTCTILMSGTFTSILQDLVTNGYIVPRPEGVLYTYTFAELPVLGFDLDNSFVAGFDQGHFS